MSSTGKPGGFTLIEIITVLLLVGILAVVAIPRLIAVPNEARKTAANSVAAALGAASAKNYSLRYDNPSQGQHIANCTDIPALVPGGLAAGYTVAANAVASGQTVTCTVTDAYGNSAEFLGHGI